MWLFLQLAPVRNCIAFGSQHGNLLEAQSTTERRSIIRAELGNNEFPESLLTLIATVLGGWVIIDSSWVAASAIAIVVSAQALPGGKASTRLTIRNRAVGTDEVVKQLVGVYFIDGQASAVEPITAIAFTLNHLAMIIRTLADAVFAAVIATGVRGARGRRSRSGAPTVVFLGVL